MGAASLPPPLSRAWPLCPYAPAGLATHLNTTVRQAGVPSGRTVASCTYFEYAKLLLLSSDDWMRAFQGAMAAIKAADQDARVKRAM